MLSATRRQLQCFSHRRVGVRARAGAGAAAAFERRGQLAPRLCAHSRPGHRDRSRGLASQPPRARGAGARPTREEVAAYQRDGVVLLRGVLSEAELELARDAVDGAIATPGPFAEFIGEGTERGTGL